ncbi:hypothetical protein [Acaryochloris sp. IP29b_bin.148]|uniref:hypothetical protein n=1 Tax=Acaryochloris sp. IP29b_bin.148 TaxID=2969218 RepID=UPI00262C1049|nr:hypothetical protein [Acaryochloris sp. IP29b_bin.148]
MATSSQQRELESLIRIPFESPEFCLDAALELEDTFDVFQVNELRPPETMEWIGEMVGIYQDRERVALSWGECLGSMTADV